MQPPPPVAGCARCRGGAGQRSFAAGGCNRVRYQSEFQSLSRAIAAAYIVRALRELAGRRRWMGRSRSEQLAERLGLAPHYHRWLRFMLK